MKIALAILFFVSSTLAEDKPALAKALAACGPSDVLFQVKTHTNGPPLATPETGKALVYLFEEQLGPCLFCTPTTRVGLDGKWVGANHGSSFFFFSVEPGVHHLCTDWQDDTGDNTGIAALASFTAEPGKTYYFRGQIWRGSDYFWGLNLAPVDPDEGQLFIAEEWFKFSTSQVMR